MAITKKKAEARLDAFMSHKVKSYASYCEFMKPRNSDININSIDFSSARLRRNKAKGR